MPSFSNTTNPTPFSLFDSEAAFISDADNMLRFVRIKLGDNIMRVELTNSQIWASFEEAAIEHSSLLAEYQMKSDLVNMLGMPTGSADVNNMYFNQTLNFLLKQAEPYANHAGVGGTQEQYLGYFELVAGQQEYDIYTDLYSVASSSLMYNLMPTGMKGRIQVNEVFHFSPQASHHYLLNASNITNYLATEFNYESYVNSTVFYVLPIFEDVLRRGMLDAAYRVRRSNYSYELIGRKLRIFPVPSQYRLQTSNKMFVRVSFPSLNSPISSSYTNNDLYGVNGPGTAPIGVIPYTSLNQWSKQWIRNYTLALCKITLGLIRRKFKSIPIPNEDVTLDGQELVDEGKEERDALRENIRTFMDEITYDKLQEKQAERAENLNKQLKYIPMPLGKAILIG